MKNYKFLIALKGKVIAKCSRKDLAIKRYNELLNYLSNPKIVVNTYLKKGETFNKEDLKLIEM